MRFFTVCVAAFAALATAQTNNQYNKLNVPTGGYQVTAGQPLTITWSAPSSGTVTIKLQQGSGAGQAITVDSGVQASAETATFTIDPSTVNTADYYIEIIDDTNNNNINYSPPFGITGATGTGSSTTGTASTTATGSTASSSGSASSASTTSASSVSGSTSSNASSTSNASSSSSASSASSASSSSATASTASKTSSSATAASSTSAPTGNSAVSYKSQSGLLIAVIGALAVF